MFLEFLCRAMDVVEIFTGTGDGDPIELRAMKAVAARNAADAKKRKQTERRRERRAAALAASAPKPPTAEELERERERAYRERIAERALHRAGFIQTMKATTPEELWDDTLEAYDRAVFQKPGGTR